MNIYQKMAAITAEMKTVNKNLDVSAGKTSYKAVSERDVLDAVKKVEKDHGVYSYPFNRETLECEQLESETEYNGKVTKKTTFYTRIKTTYRFVNVDMPDEYIDMVVFSVGLDSQDKGDGKAMTYADKYALMKAYKISTGEDPDAEGSEETEYKTTKTGSKPAEAKKPSEPVCERCGRKIVPYTGADGKEISVQKHCSGSVRKFGQILCIDCINESKNS